MSQSALVISPAITIVDGKPTTLSTDLASHFGKRHDDVLRAIDNLRAQLAEEHLRNFAETEQSRPSPLNGAPISARAYRLTRDGFTLLAMGFTGKKALAFKLAYIDAFNRMEAELQQHPAQDAQRLQLAQNLAAQAGAQVMQTVFDAIMSGTNTDWRRARYLLTFGYDRNGEATLPHAKPLADGQMVASMTELARYITQHDIAPTDTQLAALASACTQRLTERAQVRERRSAQAAALPATTKQLPPDTFKAVFV